MARNHKAEDGDFSEDVRERCLDPCSCQDKIASPITVSSKWPFVFYGYFSFFHYVFLYFSISQHLHLSYAIGWQSPVVYEVVRVEIWHLLAQDMIFHVV